MTHEECLVAEPSKEYKESRSLCIEMAAFRFKNTEEQVARLMERLQEYDFEIEHRAGTSHRNADSLSRRPCPAQCSNCSRVEEKAVVVLRRTTIGEEWFFAEISASQEKDSELRKRREWKREDRRPIWQKIAQKSQALKAYCAQWNCLVFENGVLKTMLGSDDGTAPKKQIVVPKCKVAEVFRKLDDGPSGGHLGVTKTLRKVRERFSWVNCSEDVKEWCRKCMACSVSNGLSGSSYPK